MATNFRPYISRTERIIRVLKHKPRQLFREHPEEVIFFSTFGVAGLIVAMYKLNHYGVGMQVRPWYRNYFHVVRPDAEVAMKWRLPEEYPARYQTNRDASYGLGADYGYGWSNKKV